MKCIDSIYVYSTLSNFELILYFFLIIVILTDTLSEKNRIRDVKRIQMSKGNESIVLPLVFQYSLLWK